MTNSEGAMLAGYLLPKEQYIELLSKLITKEYSNMSNKLAYIGNLLDAGYVYGALEEWENFSKTFLKNPSIDVLTVLNVSSEQSKYEYVLADELSVYNQNGSITTSNLNNISKNMKKIIALDELTNHLKKMFQEIQTQSLTYTSYAGTSNTALMGEGNYLISKLQDRSFYPNVLDRFQEVLNSKSSFKKDYSYWNIIYNRKQGVSFFDDVNARGKAIDAFFNHMAKMHSSLFSAILQGEGVSVSQSFNNSSPRMEEGINYPYPFLHLLLDSLNNARWYGGGDIILLDIHGKVILNIQLKSSKYNLSDEQHSISHLATEELAKYIESFLLDFRSPEDLAEEFYELTKTSSVTGQISTDIVNDVYSIVKKILHV